MTRWDALLPETEHGAIVRACEHIRIVTREDFTGTDGTPRGGLRRMHLFRQANGRDIQCAGRCYCRECMREAGE